MAPILVLAAIPGCVSSLPTQPWIDHDHALNVVSTRMNAVETLTANCVLVLHEPSRGSMTLEGALAMRPSGFLRIQCWKFTTKVLDLTLTPEGLWIDMKRRTESEDDDPGAMFDTERLAEAWMLFMGEMLGNQPVVIDDRGGPAFEARIDQPDLNRSIVYSIERRTLTARRCLLFGIDGELLFSLRYERYRLFDDIACPTLLVGESQAGSFQLRLSDIEINGTLGNRAFRPPRNAVLQK